MFIFYITYFYFYIMDYNNGLGFGNDMIQSFEMPMEFEHSTLPSGKTMLAAPSEFPILNTNKPRPVGQLSERRVNKKIDAPEGMVESFMSKKETHRLLLFLFIIMIVLQYQTYSQIRKMNKMQLLQMVKNPISIDVVDRK